MDRTGLTDKIRCGRCRRSPRAATPECYEDIPESFMPHVWVVPVSAVTEAAPRALSDAMRSLVSGWMADEVMDDLDAVLADAIRGLFVPVEEEARDGK